MSIFTSSPIRQSRHLILSGATIRSTTDTDLIDRVIAEKAVRNEQARRRQFAESIAA